MIVTEMKLRFFNFYITIGPAPITKNNFVSIEHRNSNCLVRLAAFAEQFYAALSFYMEIAKGMHEATDSCWFELQRRRKKRLPSES